MNVILLNGKRGGIALVDDCDFDRIVAMGPWHSLDCGHGRIYAARGTINPITGKKCSLYMHRVILGLEFGDPREGEHISGDGLDNRRSSNLRIAGHRQNICNTSKRINNTSGLKCVYWCKKSSKWYARIEAIGRAHNLGRFEDKERAHQAYCEASLRFHGEYGNTGLPAPYSQPWLAVLMYRIKFGYPQFAALGKHVIGLLFFEKLQS
jgi:hypothetical protein